MNLQMFENLYYTISFSSIGLCIQFSLLIEEVQGDTKKRELLKNPTKIEEIQEKKFIDRN